MLLHHIATGAALELAQLTAGQERQRRLGADLLRQLLDRRIDPIAAEPQIADAEHGTSYLDTLRAVFRNDRSWQLAAAELHIHKQTLAYRIRKIERLTGRGTAKTEHLAEWWFALRAHDLLTGQGPPTDPGC